MESTSVRCLAGYVSPTQQPQPTALEAITAVVETKATAAAAAAAAAASAMETERREGCSQDGENRVRDYR